MALLSKIAASYPHPRRVVRRLLAAGQREDRALAILMGGAALLFVAQWPKLARAAQTDTSVPLDARLSGALLALVFVLPLLLYLLAALSHLAARAVGGKGTFFGARLALFWALLASAPAMLFHGLVAGLIGAGAAEMAAGLIALAAFVWIWANGLVEAERGAAGAGGEERE